MGLVRTKLLKPTDLTVRDAAEIFARHGMRIKFEIRPKWVAGWRLNRTLREWSRPYMTSFGVRFDRVSLDRVD